MSSLIQKKDRIFVAGHRGMAGSAICKALKQKGLFICGMPSLESQQYASKESKEGHVNCKTQKETKILLNNFFDYVFMFSMNDEVVHTGFNKMSHYNLALCANKK